MKKILFFLIMSAFIFSGCEKVAPVATQLYCQGAPEWVEEYKDLWNYNSGTAAVKDFTKVAMDEAVKIAKEQAKNQLKEKVAAKSENMVTSFTSSLGISNKQINTAVSQHVADKISGIVFENLEVVAQSSKAGCDVYALVYLDTDILKARLKDIVLSDYKNELWAQLIYTQIENKLVTTLNNEFPFTQKPDIK